MPFVVTYCVFKIQQTRSRLRSRSAAPCILNAYNNARAQLIDGLGHATRSATVAVSRSRTQSFQPPIIFKVRIVLKMLVSLMGRLELCSVRIAADRQTDAHTHTQTKYHNPCCACALRVNPLTLVTCGVILTA